MKRFFGILLSGLILMGPSPVPVRAEAPTEICAMCGHVCCCPEVCASKRQQLSQDEGCGRVVCRVQSAPSPLGMVTSQEQSMVLNPTFCLLARLHPQHRLDFAAIDASALLIFSPLPSDLLTPPPRIAA